MRHQYEFWRIVGETDTAANRFGTRPSFDFQGPRTVVERRLVGHEVKF